MSSQNYMIPLLSEFIGTLFLVVSLAWAFSLKFDKPKKFNFLHLKLLRKNTQHLNSDFSNAKFNIFSNFYL